MPRALPGTVRRKRAMKAKETRATRAVERLPAPSAAVGTLFPPAGPGTVVPGTNAPQDPERGK